MEKVLSSSAFHIVGVPLVFVLIGVFANRLGRHDGDTSPTENDWAVGTTTLLTALGVIAADLSAVNTAKLLAVGGWFIGVLFALFISIDNDRFRSWKRDATGTPLSPGQKHILRGVILPNIFSCVIFIAYQYSKLVRP